MARASTRTSVRKPRAPKTPQEVASTAVSTALADVARAVLVVFNGNHGGRYSYMTKDADIKVGDYAVVISPHAGNSSFTLDTMQGHLTIVRVVDVQETVQSVNAASKWLLCRLPLEEALARMARQEQLKVLQAKIAKARKAAEERVQLEQLRNLSPELDALINEFDAIAQTV